MGECVIARKGGCALYKGRVKEGDGDASVGTAGGELAKWRVPFTVETTPRLGGRLSHLWTVSIT